MLVRKHQSKLIPQGPKICINVSSRGCTVVLRQALLRLDAEQTRQGHTSALPVITWDMLPGTTLVIRVVFLLCLSWA